MKYVTNALQNGLFGAIYSLMFNTGKHILKGYNNMFISKLLT